jgi:hypothetical protein
MKFSIVNGQRQEAQRNLSGKCPACEGEMVAKCGEVRIAHWAHKGRRSCDRWWENETEWHRAWKGHFPDHWQEVVHHEKNGDRHIADVKTDQGWVLEFQYSAIKPDERRSRDAFYPKLVWVVNGVRRKRDWEQFQSAWTGGTPVAAEPLIRKSSSDKCVILREWVSSSTHVLLDFVDGPNLWWMLKRADDGSVYIAEFPRSAFITIHRLGAVLGVHNFDQFANILSKKVSDYEAPVVQQSEQPTPPSRPHPLAPIRRSRRG